jgi:hypothetical protein
MWVHPTVTASTMITHVWCAAQGQMSHTGAVEIFGRVRCSVRGLCRRLKVEISRSSEAWMGRPRDWVYCGPAPQLILPDESNAQGCSLRGVLVRPWSSQLCGYAPLASPRRGEIVCASMVHCRTCRLFLEAMPPGSIEKQIPRSLSPVSPAASGSE